VRGGASDPPDAEVESREKCGYERWRAVEPLGIRDPHEQQQDEGMQGE
jgi:hypothetical protein